MHARRMHYHKIPHKGKVKWRRVVYNWFSLFSFFFYLLVLSLLFGIFVINELLIGHPQRPKAVSWFERKCVTKAFKHGQKSSPWVLTLTHFQKVKRMLTPDWAQNIICIILPNRQTASSEFFSSIRTRGLWSSHTCPFSSPKLNMQGKIIFSTFLTKYEGTTDDSRKRFGFY